MFFQVSLNFLSNGIEILHIYMSPANNNRDVYLIFFLQKHLLFES